MERETSNTLIGILCILGGLAIAISDDFTFRGAPVTSFTGWIFFFIGIVFLIYSNKKEKKDRAQKERKK